MTEEDALCAEQGCKGDSDQGSKAESDIPLTRPSTIGLYSQKDRPSGRGLEMANVMTEDLESVESHGNL